jgi:hypothetical protein
MLLHANFLDPKKSKSRNYGETACITIKGIRSLWGEYHALRPHFTGRPSGLVSYGQFKSLLTSLYRSPIAGTKLANLSLQTTPCKEDEKKLPKEKAAHKLLLKLIP